MTEMATSTLSDPWEMALIHRLMRRGFEQARGFVLDAGAARRAPAVAEYVTFHLDGLGAHHATEDELLWPALSERVGLSGELIRRMEDQHHAVHDAVETARRELAAWGPAPTRARSGSLAAALEDLERRLSEHLEDEERDVVPLIARHVTQDEWDHLGKAAFDRFTPKQRFTAMGEMLRTADPTESARMMAGLPPPIRLVWRLLGRGKYERFMARVHG